MDARVRSEITSEMNVTPMLDVLLVLLIVVMLLALPVSHIDLQLPERGAPGSSELIVLEVRGGGAFAINGAPVESARLAQRLHEIYDHRPTRVLFVAGAPRVTYDAVVHAMDVAKGAGVAALAAMPAERAP